MEGIENASREIHPRTLRFKSWTTGGAVAVAGSDPQRASKPSRRPAVAKPNPQAFCRIFAPPASRIGPTSPAQGDLCRSIRAGQSVGLPPRAPISPRVGRRGPALTWLVRQEGSDELLSGHQLREQRLRLRPDESGPDVLSIRADFPSGWEEQYRVILRRGSVSKPGENEPSLTT
jgi:hypothetical protein